MRMKMRMRRIESTSFMKISELNSLFFGSADSV